MKIDAHIWPKCRCKFDTEMKVSIQSINPLTPGNSSLLC